MVAVKSERVATASTPRVAEIGAGLLTYVALRIGPVVNVTVAGLLCSGVFVTPVGTSAVGVIGRCNDG